MAWKNKAFDLHLLVGRENIMGNKQKVNIESIDLKGKNLYVGATDGTIYHFLLLEGDNKSTATCESNCDIYCFLQAQTRTPSKKAVSQIKASDALKCLITNVGGVIQGFSMLDLSPSFEILGRLRHVNKFYVNEHPTDPDPFSIEMFVTFVRKRHVHVYRVQEDSVIPLKDISFGDTPLSLAVDGHVVCVAGVSNYILYDLSSNKKQELLPVENGKAFVKRVGSGEFLLLGPNALGVFVTSAGISQRPPIQWSHDVSLASFVHPFVIALDSQCISVYSVTGLKTKQSWPFQGGLHLSQDDDNVVICTAKDIFILCLVPFEEQISILIENGHVEEGIDLAKECVKVSNRHQFKELLTMTFRKAAFQYLKMLDFEHAGKMFMKSEIDPREIVALYPQLLPQDSLFVANSLPYHTITCIDDICSNSSKDLSRCYEFLSNYLLCNVIPNVIKHSRNASSSDEITDAFYRRDILLSALSVFATLNQTNFILLLFHGVSDAEPTLPGNLPPHFDIFIKDMKKVLEILNEHGCSHALASFKLMVGDVDGAMSEWKNLVIGAKSDTCFPGLEFVAEMLGRHYVESDILWKHAQWILSHNENLCLRIFTSLAAPNCHDVNCESGNCPKVDDIVNFLHPFKTATLQCLEHLVLVCDVQKEKFHTHLVVMYLENIIKLKQMQNCDKQYDFFRLKLQKVLKQSNLYRTNLILGKIEAADLYIENVIICERQGDLKKALDILVNKVKDPLAAELFCIGHSDNPERRRQLFKSLLDVYLSKTAISGTKSSKYIATITDLLNRRAKYFDPSGVMTLVSENWSAQLLGQFLTEAARSSMHFCQTGKLEKMIMLRRHHDLKNSLSESLRGSVFMAEHCTCPACGLALNDAECVAYPNLVFVHSHCRKDDHICPVTGQIFMLSKKVTS